MSASVATRGASENIAAVLHGVDDLRVEPVSMPTPAPDEVLLRVQSVGICGSDHHYLKHGRIGAFVCRGPLVLGHEASAVVHAKGASVTALALGDRVAVEPGVPCAACTLCRGGRYNLCADVRFAATPPVHGSLARYVAHPAAFCYPLPKAMSFDVAALLEPLSVAIHAVRRAKVGLGSTVFVAGAGTVGILCVVAAKAAGAARVVCTDVDEFRLGVVAEMGADEIVLVKGGLEDPREEGRRIAADACIECSGVEASARLCVFAARPGGVVVLVGMGKPDMSLPILDAGCREVDIRGVFRYANTYPAAIKMATSVDLTPLITHRFSLEEARDAFSAFEEKETRSIKIVIDCASGL